MLHVGITIHSKISHISQHISSTSLLRKHIIQHSEIASDDFFMKLFTPLAGVAPLIISICLNPDPEFCTSARANWGIIYSKVIHFKINFLFPTLGQCQPKLFFHLGLNANYYPQQRMLVLDIFYTNLYHDDFHRETLFYTILEWNYNSFEIGLNQTLFFQIVCNLNFQVQFHSARQN